MNDSVEIKPHNDLLPDDFDKSPAEQRRLALVLIDIGGYTQFMVSTRMSALHAQEIIFLLLESIIETSKHPLVFNKLEGDAILLYARATEDAPTVAEDVMKQVEMFFSAFRRKSKELTQDRAACSCAACNNIGALRLKAIVHLGTAVFRNIRGFVELGGEDVIIVHRLLKNSVALSEYILVTEKFHEHLKRLHEEQSERIIEKEPVLGEIAIWVRPAPSC